MVIKDDSSPEKKEYVEVFRDDPLKRDLIDLSELESNKSKVINSFSDGILICTMCALQHCDNYKLLYIQSFNQNSWNPILNLILAYGLIASILLAVSLMLIIRTLVQPVSTLAMEMREYARGDHSKKLATEGWGEVAELAVLINALTDETQRLEAAEEDSRRKQRFLDSFTHELRTPLTNIHGYSELMKRVQLNEEDRLRYLDYMMHESRRLTRLSEELFSLTELHDDIIQMEFLPCSVLLKAARQSLENKAKNKNVSFVSEETDCTIYGNAALLESLCTNLCENAIRACGECDVVRVRFQNDSENVLLRVADTGRGIAPDQLMHITEPFYRVDKARSRAEGGVGLGLYLCSEIVRVHGAV
ncbi:MAG: HAMP domain-containing histidine kinase, partial [Oscillospiraceae bacterium]|nr:HAMP domain-containing histidine kinase [Oscillospiraceae bacterium]